MIDRLKSTYYTKYESLYFRKKSHQLKNLNEMLKLSEDGKVVVWADESIHEVIIPDGVEEIGENAFKNRYLLSIQFPDSLTKIGKGAFSHCGFRNINLPKSLKRIGDSSFEYADFESFDIPEGVEEIGLAAFGSCRKLKYVHLPNSLKFIESAAFAATGLVYLHIPEGVIEIGTGAFFNIENLQYISIPSTIERLNDPFIAVELTEAHCYITDLNKLECFGDFFVCKYLYVPSGMLEAYKQHPYFGQAENIVERG